MREQESWLSVWRDGSYVILKFNGTPPQKVALTPQAARELAGDLAVQAGRMQQLWKQAPAEGEQDG